MRYRIRNQANNGWVDICEDQVRLRDKTNTSWINTSNSFVTRRIRMQNNTWKDLDCAYPCDFQLKFSGTGSYYPETFDVPMEATTVANRYIHAVVQAFTVPDKFALEWGTGTDDGGWRGNFDTANWSTFDPQIPTLGGSQEAWLKNEIGLDNQIGYDVVEVLSKTTGPALANVAVNSAHSNTGFWTGFGCPTVSSVRSGYNTIRNTDGNFANGRMNIHGITIDGDPIVTPTVSKLSVGDSRIISTPPESSNSFIPSQRFRALKASSFDTLHVRFPSRSFGLDEYMVCDVRNLVGGTLIKTVGPNNLAPDANGIFTYNIAQTFGDGLALELYKISV